MISAIQTKVYAGEGAKVELYVVQTMNAEAVCLHDVGVSCEKDAAVKEVQLELGGAEVYTGTLFELSGEESTAELVSGYLGTGRQKIDMNYVARHRGKKTKSNMQISGILKNEAKKLLREGSLPVLADPECACREELAPDALVDAILAKRNLGTKIDDAPIVVGVGPGFTAGEDCHAVVETMRGHTLGRVIYSGSALPNTNIPGLIGGFAGERVLRAPCDGIFTAVHRIGDTVEEGETIGFVEGQPMKCTISGVLRGVLDDGVSVKKGMKSGDVDPRCKPEYCTTISDKALAVGGGVVEAVLYLSAKAQGRR